MNVQDLGAIGEFISSIAIVITLIFLTMETRRARNATQQSNRQARHRIRTDIDISAALNPQLTEVIAKSIRHLAGSSTPRSTTASDFGLSDAEWIQLRSVVMSSLRHFEDTYFSDLPETDRSALESQTRSFLNISAFSKCWERSKNEFDHRFQEYVDNLIRERTQGDDQS